MAFGKFEGEPTYTEYFWDIALGGAGHEVYLDDVEYTFINVEQEDRDLYPELPVQKYIVVWETEQGFVCHSFANALPED
jgi:hypothetical protein